MDAIRAFAQYIDQLGEAASKQRKAERRRERNQEKREGAIHSM